MATHLTEATQPTVQQNPPAISNGQHRRQGNHHRLPFFTAKRRMRRWPILPPSIWKRGGADDCSTVLRRMRDTRHHPSSSCIEWMSTVVTNINKDSLRSEQMCCIIIGASTKQLFGIVCCVGSLPAWVFGSKFLFRKLFTSSSSVRY